MQLNITTDYAIRIVYYLALKEETITASELASVLKIPVNYISKITKKLKAAEIVQACEGIKGGYALMKKPEMISLFDIVSSMEVTMKIAVWSRMDSALEMLRIIATYIKLC